MSGKPAAQQVSPFSFCSLLLWWYQLRKKKQLLILLMLWSSLMVPGGARTQIPALGISWAKKKKKSFNFINVVIKGVGLAFWVCLGWLRSNYWFTIKPFLMCQQLICEIKHQGFKLLFSNTAQREMRLTWHLLMLVPSVWFPSRQVPRSLWSGWGRIIPFEKVWFFFHLKQIKCC